MCFHSRLTQHLSKICSKFQVSSSEFSDEFTYGDFNAFSFPPLPVICNDQPDRLLMLYWGLIPRWAKNPEIRKYTLNARMETIHEKPAFRGAAMQRCLIPANGFYEWKWLDPQGRKKEKYLIHLPGDELFALGGLWSEYTDPQAGEIMRTFTVLTTKANALLSEIHNSKKRMPLGFNPQNGLAWLSGKEAMACSDLWEAVRC